MIKTLKFFNISMIISLAFTLSLHAQDVLYSRSQGYTESSMEKKYKINANTKNIKEL